MSQSREYAIWRQMRQRCSNPNAQSWDNYGGRGIKVYQEWDDSFDEFYKYVGPSPSPKYSLDRYPDNDGNYEPGNVRWATMKEQSSNRRPARLKPNTINAVLSLGV